TPSLLRGAGQTSAFRQRVNGSLVETLSGGARLFTERVIEDFRNSSNCILHASIIGIAGMLCKHLRTAKQLSQRTHHKFAFAVTRMRKCEALTATAMRAVEDQIEINDARRVAPGPPPAQPSL